MKKTTSKGKVARRRTWIVEKVVRHHSTSFWRGVDGWWWTLVAQGNHEILAMSETYTTLEKCDQTAERVAAQLGVPYIKENPQ